MLGGGGSTVIRPLGPWILLSGPAIRHHGPGSASLYRPVGVKLPLALAELGLIDEYEFVVHPRLAGHGPTLFAGMSKHVDLKLVSRLEFASGAVAMRYEPRR